MQPNTLLSDGLLDNEAKFQHPFFSRFQLHQAPSPLKLSQDIEKRYQFPTLYANVTCAQAIFLCNYDKAQALMPHPFMKPVRVPGNRALVAFSNYIYRDVMNIAPYNEIAMTIPMMVAPKFDLPLLPAVVPGFKSFGYYVFSMPVTSLENCIRGNEIWGLPKVVQQIDIEQNGDQSLTCATDEQDNHYLSIRVPTKGRKSRFDVSANLYSVKDGQLLQSRTCFTGEFEVNKYLSKLWTPKPAGDTPFLTLGEGPFAERLRALEIDGQPFQTRYCDDMQACFDLANADYRAPFNL
ncbi:acetoacetate decarboxylase family protein [Aliiglaciecola sp. CAU 1673]|uniref:acetoacetate decarboxylase family protein n=1 Tax=Aliiglaciecola sp. CAU 1673 TaxID=3032595 RepID=UPI0023DBE3BB|nr:acetoacetate decarboxylase family protein [Aliiglaciecola sp. CAU 1673]MDF2179302.1 acetoacetate decarboxylase family protein [Aliiglaciecola sp. CAU 1673]